MYSAMMLLLGVQIESVIHRGYLWDYSYRYLSAGGRRSLSERAVLSRFVLRASECYARWADRGHNQKAAGSSIVGTDQLISTCRNQRARISADDVA